MNVYMIHIRPRGGEANHELSSEYCLNNNVLGVGWGVKAESGIDWEEYKQLAEKEYGDINRVQYLYERLTKDDFIWTRDTNANYYLAKVISGWEYCTNPEAIRADILNIVRCEDIFQIESIDQTPGKVKACFCRGQAIRRIGNERDGSGEAILEYSKYLWSKFKKTPYTPSGKITSSIFDFLDSEQTEDVIFIYLQKNGWIVIPNSRRADTMRYEFYMINEKTKERGVVQVKTGNTSLTPKDWADSQEKVFLFQAKGFYEGEQCNNVACIQPDEINEFIVNNKDILPANIGYWLEILQQKT